MQVVTSYFAKGKEIRERGLAALVSIARSTPAWLPEARKQGVPELFPSWELIKGVKEGRITTEEYTEQYTAQLRSLDAAALVASLEERFGPKVALLCWEAPGAFCHRRLVAAWIERETGLAVPELDLGQRPVQAGLPLQD